MGLIWNALAARTTTNRTTNTGNQMLILSRKPNEQIVINDDIIITVVHIRGGVVRLGVEAPPHIPVHRKEIYDAIQAGKLVPREQENPKTTKSDEPVQEHLRRPQ